MKYQTVLTDQKTGQVIHKFVMPTKRAAILKRNNFYKVLVMKLRQKVLISVKKAS